MKTPPYMRFFAAVAMLVGTIVGAGVFGLPYVFAQAGFFIGFTHLLLLTGAVVLLHLFFGEIILRTPGQHRLVGYARMYLGRWGAILISISTIVGVSGALLAYIVLGGSFLSLLFPSVSEGIFSIAFWFVFALLVSRGIRTVAWSELIAGWLLIGTFLFFLAMSVGKIQMLHLASARLENFMVPYGVVLFSLAGSSAIPEIRSFLGARLRLFPAIIALGTVLPALLYLLFVGAVVGVMGEATAPNALEGIAKALGNIPAAMMAAFGILAIGTSFLVLASYLVDTYRLDFRFPRPLALAAGLVIPLSMFLLGLRSFIEIIGFVGIVFGGVEGVAVALIFLVARRSGKRTPEYALNIPALVPYGLITALVMGVFAYLAVSFIRGS